MAVAALPTPITVTDLITESFYLSSVISEELETISGLQLSIGLRLLNALLAVKSIDGSKITYYQKYDFTAVIGQEMYFIPGLIDLATFTFFLDTIRYSMIKQYRKPYFGSPRAEGIQSLPGQWHHERTLNGTNLFIYFFPDKNYPMQIYGKFALTNVTLNQDLTLILDQFYIEYLRYELANYICGDYNLDFSPSNARILANYENQLKDISAFDLTMVKMSYLQKQAGLNYGQANLGHGWTTIS